MELSSGTSSGDNRPPIIAASASLVSAPPQQTGKPIVQLLVMAASICFGLFLADALISLADDTLVLALNVHPLSGLRGVIGTFSMIISLVVYLLLGLTPALPKRFFLPITLFGPVGLLLVLPAWMYFPSQVQLIAWIGSLIQVILGALLLWLIQASFKLAWPLVPERLMGSRLFSWQNLAGFCAANLLLLLPGIAGYLVFCGARAIDHYSDGFVALRGSGFTVQVRKYIRDDGKSILLVPMAHIGEPEFYHRLSQSFPTNSTILMEGVKDEKNLLTNHLTYKRVATSLGLSQQQKEFKPSPIQVVPADIDVDQFAPGTIDFLNLVALIHSRGLTAKNLLLLMQSSGSPEFEQQIFNDILHKRNRHLLQEIHDQLPLSDELVVPWGAAHMPEIAREIKKSGFRLDSSQEYIAIRFGGNKRHRVR